MGKHAKPKINYRAALLIGAAPIAMLLASPGISSAAESIDLGGTKLTPDYDRGHSVTHDHGITSVKDFASGYVDAVNNTSRTVPLADGVANYASTQHNVTGGEAGTTNSYGNGTLGNSSYAKGHEAGSSDLAGGMHRGGYGFTGTDSNTRSGDLGGSQSESYGPHGAAMGNSGVARGATGHAGGMAGDLGDGRSAAMTNGQKLTGLLSGTSHGAVDPKAGAGALGGAANGATSGGNTIGGVLDLGDGNKAGASGVQGMTGALGGSQDMAADKSGNMTSTGKNNGAFGGTNGLTGGGSFGPGHGSLTSAQSGTISGLVDGADAHTADGKGAAAHSGTISGVMDNANGGEFGIDHVVDGAVASHQKGAMGGTVSGVAGINPDDLAGSSAGMTSSRNLAGADDTSGTLSVLDLVDVSGSEKTGVTQRGAEAATENGFSSPVEHGNVAHSNDMQVQVLGMKPIGGGLDVATSPLTVAPHFAGPQGDVRPGNLVPEQLRDVTNKVSALGGELGELSPGNLR